MPTCIPPDVFGSASVVMVACGGSVSALSLYIHTSYIHTCIYGMQYIAYMACNILHMKYITYVHDFTGAIYYICNTCSMIYKVSSGVRYAYSVAGSVVDSFPIRDQQ